MQYNFIILFHVRIFQTECGIKLNYFLAIYNHSIPSLFFEPTILAATIALIKMITTTQTKHIILEGIDDERMQVDGKDKLYDDWRDDLARNGYAVIKGAIPRERADQYANKMYSWLEGL